MEAETGTHRVAEVGRPSTDLGHQQGPVLQTDGDGARAPVAGQVDQDHLVVGGQIVAPASPTPDRSG